MEKNEMYFKRLKIVFTITMVVFVSSCVSSVPYKLDETSKIDLIGSNMSKVVFIRSHAFIAGGKIPAVLFDVTGKDEKLISPILHQTKVVYDVEPGEHLFMVNSDEAVDFMKANLLPGKIYYVVVRPFPGSMTYRFSFAPVRQSPQSEFNITQERFKEWISSTKLVTKTTETDLWFKNNKQEIRTKRNNFWPKWLSKPEVQRMSQTIEPRDGN